MSEPGEFADEFDWTTDDNINRPRGILSPRERAHLWGRLNEDPEEDADAIRQREYRIRQHIRHALIDFYYLGRREVAHKALSDVDSEPEDTAPDNPRMVRSGIQELMYLLYSTLETTPEREKPHPKATTAPFSQLLEDGIRDALVDYYIQQGFSVVPSAGFSVYLGKKIPIEDLKPIYDQFPEKVLLTPELMALVYAGEISPDEYDTRFEEMQQLEDTHPESYQQARIEAYRRRGYGIKWTDDGEILLDPPDE